MRYPRILRSPLLRFSVPLLVLALSARAAPDTPRGGSTGPAASFSQVLGRPTDRSITLSLLSSTSCEAKVEFGVDDGGSAERTPPQSLVAGQPREFELGDLKPDTAYVYRVFVRETPKGEFHPEPAGTFHTQRAPGRTFTFGLQGDSHPERAGKMYDAALYTRTLRDVARDAPDFYITLGDDFSIERLIARHTATQSSVNDVYALQRSFLGTVGRNAALFLVNGNHEQAARANLDGTPNSPAILAGRARTTYYPLPAPDRFYSGDAEEIPHLGLPRDYYAWTWGDALFVVIDPYWHSAVTVDNEAGAEHRDAGDARGNDKKRNERNVGEGKPGGGKSGDGRKNRDLWDVTLGETQYRWLATTLSTSKARWKFVFSHHVLGTGRGGVECAPYFEWGGQDRRGGSAFARHRPGFECPIHELFVRHGVTIFFQGHDHLYARQELDGVIYQSCPNPADATYTAFNQQAYRSGDILPNAGHLRVTVAPENVRVDYVRTFLPSDEGEGRVSGTVAHSYTLRPRNAPAAK